ncbi:MAG TPA: alpha/beta hydrolase [Candidatus Nanopelagicales bacterium]
MAAAAAGVGGLIAARALLPPGTPAVHGPRAVSVLEKVRLGGAEQWVLQRSADIGNPLVLFLHGGPGTSQLTANRRNTRSLEKSFTVVNWDQRGAGKSYRAIRDTERMTIEQFVHDTRDLTMRLLDRYAQQRLVLVGHSWGSVIGAMAAAAHPELYHCYVGIGQLARMAEGEELSYRWALQQARERRDDKAIGVLAAMGPPPYRGDWQKATVRQRALLAQFGGEVHDSRRGALGPVLSALLFSREYTYLDRVNYFRGIFGSMRLLWPELMEVNLFETVPEIGVPVVLAEGRHDMECPSEIAERYFCALRAPSKELVWFERSAHLPNTEEREEFNRMMVEIVLPLTGPREGRPLEPGDR